MRSPLIWVVCGVLSLAASGCAPHRAARPPMTQAQADAKLESLAAQPGSPAEAKAAANEVSIDAQAQQMLDQGH